VPRALNKTAADLLLDRPGSDPRVRTVSGAGLEISSPGVLATDKPSPLPIATRSLPSAGPFASLAPFRACPPGGRRASRSLLRARRGGLRRLQCDAGRGAPRVGNVPRRLRQRRAAAQYGTHAHVGGARRTAPRGRHNLRLTHASSSAAPSRAVARISPGTPHSEEREASETTLPARRGRACPTGSSQEGASAEEPDILQYNRFRVTTLNHRGRCPWRSSRL
jgi:hypothetical protein